MFVCKECIKNYKIYNSFMLKIGLKSYGKCEVCKIIKICYDIPK